MSNIDIGVLSKNAPAKLGSRQTQVNRFLGKGRSTCRFVTKEVTGIGANIFSLPTAH